MKYWKSGLFDRIILAVEEIDPHAEVTNIIRASI